MSLWPFWSRTCRWTVSATQRTDALPGAAGDSVGLHDDREDRDGSCTEAAGVMAPGIILGVGMGGFVDGILLHQILQWHHMLTSTNDDRLGVDYYPASTVHGLEINTLWDGLFHTFTWLAVLTGLWLLYARVATNRLTCGAPARCGDGCSSAGACSTSSRGSSITRSWGSTTSGPAPDRSGVDLGFLAIGAVFVIGGYTLQRGSELPITEAEPARDA